MSDDRQPVNGDGYGPAWVRLEDQLAWYDRKSVAAQHAYKRVKLAQLMIGATVPVVAALQFSAAVTATLAAFVFIAECTQQLYQWQTDWVLYRTTANALQQEKYLYLAAAEPYSGDDRHRVLAERIEDLISQEHGKWVDVKSMDARDRTSAKITL